jgi:alpha-1,2-mannosyltransferase
VWFVPLLVHLGLRAYRDRSRGAAAALWLIAACFGGWFVASSSSPPQAGLLSLRHPGLWDQLLPATYLFLFLLVLAVSASTLRWGPLRAPHRANDLEQERQTIPLEVA